MTSERPDSALRIQLEGRLEAFEAALAQWRAAGAALGGPEWQTDRRWRTISELSPETVDAVSQKAGDASYARELEDAQERVSFVAGQHLRSLGLEPPAAVASRLALLERELPQQEVSWHGAGRFEAPMAPFAAGIAFLVLMLPSLWVAGAERDPRFVWLCAGLNLVAAGLSLFVGRMVSIGQAPVYRVQVTDHSVRLFEPTKRPRTFKKGYLTALRVRPHGGGWLLRFIAHPHSESVELSSMDERKEVIEMLEAHGIAIERST